MPKQNELGEVLPVKLIMSGPDIAVVYDFCIPEFIEQFECWSQVFEAFFIASLLIWQ